MRSPYEPVGLPGLKPLSPDQQITSLRRRVANLESSVQAEKKLTRKLKAIAHAAWHALDDSCDPGDISDDILIRRCDYESLCDELESLHGPDGDIHDHL